MGATKGGLGKGLGALLGNVQSVQSVQPAAPSSKDNVQEVETDKIAPNRYQPREDFDEAALAELADSVGRYGVLQPVLVRPLPGEDKYELIAGERRLRAAKAAGLERVPVLVREYSDAEISAIALIENLQREDLSIIEQARGCQRLLDEFHLTQEELAGRLGKSRAALTNTLRLLSLSPEVQELLSAGVLTAGQARPLLALEKPLQQQAADYIQEHELSARQCEQLAKKLADNPRALEQGQAAKAPKQAAEQSVYVKEAAGRLRELLGTQVKIQPGKKKSKIEIEFYTEEDLERILSLIGEKRETSKQSKIDALRKFSQTGKFTV